MARRAGRTRGTADGTAPVPQGGGAGTEHHHGERDEAQDELGAAVAMNHIETDDQTIAAIAR